MKKSLVTAAILIMLFISGCKIFDKSAKQKENPSNNEISTENNADPNQGNNQGNTLSKGNS